MNVAFEKKELRKWAGARGLKLTELAEMLGVPYQTVIGWDMRGATPPAYVERLIRSKLVDLDKTLPDTAQSKPVVPAVRKQRTSGKLIAARRAA